MILNLYSYVAYIAHNDNIDDIVSGYSDFGIAAFRLYGAYVGQVEHPGRLRLNTIVAKG